MKTCALCRKEFEKEEPAVLTMTALGNPKYLCEDCEKDLDEATLARDPRVISDAMERIGAKLVRENNSDKLVLDTVDGLLREARERAELIESGDYDFESDAEEDELDDVPDELKESEEDKARDEAEAKAAKKADKIVNVVCIAAVLAACGYLVYRLITFFAR